MRPALLHDLLESAAGEAGGRPAITSQGRTWTYAELHAASRRLAAWLAGGRAARGDRVVISLAPGPELVALVWAVAGAGAAFCVLHDGVRRRTLEHVLGDCEPALVASDDPAVVAQASARGVAVLEGAQLAAIAAGTPAGGPLAAPLPVDPVGLVYTSGSTALPKAVVSTHQQVLFAVEAIHGQLRYTDRDVVYCPLPLSFDYGLYQVFLCARARAHLWLGAPAEAGPSLVANLDRSGATVLAGVPVVAQALAKLLRRRPAALGLRLLTNTGSAMPPAVLAELRERVPGLRVQLMFGLTECKRVAIMPPDGDLERPGASGLPLPGTEVTVVDESGRPLPPGEIGELVVRGPHVMAGYWRRPEETARRFPRVEGLFPELRTGDYGWLDQDGYLYFAGRRDDIYKQRGFRVSATEVEAAACRIPGVRAAALIPPADDGAGATLFVAGDLTDAELHMKLRDELEDFKLPSRCVVLDDLPLTPSGKVAKPALGAMLVEGTR
jgi:acyl-CoA synthetase (AMP-forming)/AMP-acid ligase II